MKEIKRSGKAGARDLAVLMGVAGMAALIIAILLRSAAVSTAKEDIRQTADRSAAQLRDLIGRVEDSLIAAREYGVDPADMETAGHYFTTSVFSGFRKLSGISLVAQDGNSFYLLRDGTLKDIRAEGSYEPEDRGWFKGALEMQDEGACHWTGVYQFLTLEQAGITASLSWKNRRGKDVVAAYDILLDNFFVAVSNIPRRASSLTFVFDVAGGEDALYVPDESMHLARRGFETWQGEARESGSGVRVRDARIEGDTWWCGFAPLEEENPARWICVMVPQGSLLGASLSLLYSGILSILVAVILTSYLIFARRRAGSLFGPEPVPDGIRAIIGKGENTEVEFKSTMRMNLHSKKPGREIEVAWLKGVAAFLNTDGGTLLLGVTDTGEITGLEQDVFENDDKCRLHFKNLIAKGLGADLSKYIRFTLIPVDGKTLGVVECLKSSRPVYLRDGNKETFYIRNGPSSDELPASRMVDYIAEQWK